MACKYVKDFTFSSDNGYSGSAGQKPVRGYMRGGKVEKVLKEYSEGKLHSGSKKGPEVTSRKQAVAIALSEAGKSKPVKKSIGGIIKKLSPLAAAASGDAPKGIGVLGGAAGLLLEQALRKKRAGQALNAQENAAVSGSAQMAMGGLATVASVPMGAKPRPVMSKAVPVASRTPMIRGPLDRR